MKPYSPVSSCVFLCCGLFFLFASAMSTLAQNISATITAANGPSGTLTSPHFVIDSDAANADAAYNRDSIPGSVTVRFDWLGGNFDSGTETFRVLARLLDANNQPVQLANANSTNFAIASSPFDVSLSGPNLFFSPTSVSLFRELRPMPAGDLGSGGQYRIEYEVQRREPHPILAGAFWWVQVGSRGTSTAFVVVHFNDLPEDPAARYVRGYLRGTPTWSKTHAVQTGTPLSSSFRVSLNYTHVRYDVGGTTVQIPTRFTFTMEDESGNSIPLENGGVEEVAFTRNAFNTGTPNTPAIYNFPRTFNIRPTVQLDARNRTYKVRVKFEHLEKLPGTYRDNGTSNDSSLQQLLHFNGNLRFGSGSNAVHTVFSAYSNSPTVSGTGDGFVNTQLAVTSGLIPGYANYSYGDGSTLGVRLLINGDAEVASGSQLMQVAGGGEVEANFGGVRVIYPAVTLRSYGPTSNAVRVRLPQGLTYTPDRAESGGRYLPDFVVPGLRTLNNQFRHTGTLNQSTPVDAWVFDESRSLLYQATNFSMTSTGQIRFTTPDVEWVHQKASVKLMEDHAAGYHETPDMAFRCSNEGYLQKAAMAGTSSTTNFAAAADGTARCILADLVLGSLDFTTHFPLDAAISMGSGEMRIRSGRVTNDSFLGNISPFKLSYDRACEGDEQCGPGPATSVAEIDVTPVNGNLKLTSDGGIYGAVSMDSSEISWGMRGDGKVAHRSGEFHQGEFFASGNQLYEAENPLATGAPQHRIPNLLGPAVITLAGYDSTNPEIPVYPNTNGYRDGVGAWPGATFTVIDGGQFGASKLADMNDDFPYGLQAEVTKYYVRKSGLSGRHVAEDDLPMTGMKLYGYNFGITRFQLTFLSNKNVESWTNGSVAVPYPSGFKQDFTELTLKCSGALDQAKIDPNDNGPKPLAYWNGQFTPISMRFAPEDGAGCYAPHHLTMGVISGAANIETPLSGTLAFLENGDIASPDDAIMGVDSRLGLPGRVPLAGPGNEEYQLNPVTKLYFNKHFDADRPERGFVSFAATCNVPFFLDLQLHVMTSAQAESPAPVYFASGWEDDDEKTFFSNHLFDPAHRGFPAGISAKDYQSPSEKTPYLVEARQSIFGLVDLIYPLRWNPSARFFQSWEPAVPVELLVLKAEHQVDYLSAENAEITFGAQYDGLPSINLVSSAYDAVDERLGAARAVAKAAEDFVADTLNRGVDELGNLVNDNMENLLAGAIDRIESKVIDPLYEAVKEAYEQAPSGMTYEEWLDDSTNGLQSVFDEFFSKTVVAGSDTVMGQLQILADTANDGLGFVKRVEDAIEQGILAIDSVIGEIQTTRDVAGNIVVGFEVPDNKVEDTYKGIIAPVNVGADTFERQIIQNLVAELIRELAPPEIADVLNPLLADTNSEINAKFQELLVKFDPTLNRITDVLMEVRGTLLQVKQKLGEGQEIVGNFQAIIGAATAEIQSIVDGMRVKAHAFIENIADGLASPLTEPLEEIGGLIDEFDKDEFMAMLRDELRNQLLNTEFVQQIQYVLRQHISELDIAMRSAIDSAFGEVNRICKQLIKEALGPIDDTIEALLGEVESVMSAGSVAGYAHIQGHTLRRLRLDAVVELKVPDELRLQAYFEMLCYDSQTSTGSSGESSCLQEGGKVVEVRVGAIDVPLEWLSPGMRADFGAWFAMETSPEVRPSGIGGKLAMTAGELNFQGLKVTAFSSTVALGKQENYLAASARVIISDYMAAGGIFFGRTCSPEPLMQVDPDAASVLGEAPFTGAYVYGEVWIPISEVILGIPASCMFRISAGVGAGAFYFVEGPTYGGRMLLGVSGEALCTVSISGEVSLVGVMTAGNMRFAGRGSIVGKAGPCPLCLRYRESVKVTYQDDSWSVEF